MSTSEVEQVSTTSEDEQVSTPVDPSDTKKPYLRTSKEWERIVAAQIALRTAKSKHEYLSNEEREIDSNVEDLCEIHESIQKTMEEARINLSTSLIALACVTNFKNADYHLAAQRYFFQVIDSTDKFTKAGEMLCRERRRSEINEKKGIKAKKDVQKQTRWLNFLMKEG